MQRLEELGDRDAVPGAVMVCVLGGGDSLWQPDGCSVHAVPGLILVQ